VGHVLGCFSLGYVWYFCCRGCPSYLVGERGFQCSLAVLDLCPLGDGGNLRVGDGSRTADRAWRMVLARKTDERASALCVTLLPAASSTHLSLSIVMLVVSCSALGLFTSNVWAITQTRREREPQAWTDRMRWATWVV
jgi:hypothetical protein